MPLDAAQILFSDPQVTSNNALKPASIVGSGNVWLPAVGGEDTYTEVWISARPEVAVRDYAYAAVEPIEIPASTSLLFMLLSVNLYQMNEMSGTSNAFTVRFSESLDFDAAGIYLSQPGDANLEVPLDMGQNVFVEAHPAPGMDGATELRDFATGELASPEYVKELFGNGCYLVITRLSDGDVIPYDLGIQVNEVIGSLWWITSGQTPPLRRLQRDDRNGRGNPTSRQNSLRRLGYV